VHDGTDCRQRCQPHDAIGKTGCFLPTHAGHFANARLAGRLVEQEQVGVGAPDINADDQASACTRIRFDHVT
jgi:hypothetical protein